MVFFENIIDKLKKIQTSLDKDNGRIALCIEGNGEMSLTFELAENSPLETFDYEAKDINLLVNRLNQIITELPKTDNNTDTKEKIELIVNNKDLELINEIMKLIFETGSKNKFGVNETKNKK